MGWKIVRDHQPEYCREHGVSGKWRVSPDPVRALTKKLFEEASEWAESYDAAELYDLRDVLSELLYIRDPDGLIGLQHAAKITRLGRFNSHLEWHPEPEGTISGS